MFQSRILFFSNFHKITLIELFTNQSTATYLNLHSDFIYELRVKMMSY